MLAREQKDRMTATGLNALREWISSPDDMQPDDWRLVEGLAAVLIESAATCNGNWLDLINVVTGIVTAIYNIGVARGKQG